MITEIVKFNDPNLKELLKVCYLEMQFDKEGVGFDLLYDGISNSFDNNNAVGVLHETGTEVDGAMVCLVTNNLAIESIWHSHPDLSPFKRMKIMRNLLLGMKDKLRELGIRYFHISSSVKFPTISKMLHKNDFKLTELHHVGII